MTEICVVASDVLITIKTVLITIGNKWFVDILNVCMHVYMFFFEWHIKRQSE